LKLIGLKTAGSLKRVGLCIVSYKIFPHQWWSLNPAESLLRVDRYTGYILRRLDISGIPVFVQIPVWRYWQFKNTDIPTFC
jgi:hypothetical protein